MCICMGEALDIGLEELTSCRRAIKFCLGFEFLSASELPPEAIAKSRERASSHYCMLYANAVLLCAHVFLESSGVCVRGETRVI